MRFFEIMELSSGAASAILNAVLEASTRESLWNGDRWGQCYDWCACRNHYPNEKEEFTYALNSQHCTLLSSGKWTGS